MGRSTRSHASARVHVAHARKPIPPLAWKLSSLGQRARENIAKGASAACVLSIFFGSLLLILLARSSPIWLANQDTDNGPGLQSHVRRSLLQSEQVASDARTFFQWQPRRNYAGGDVSPEFCGYRNGACELQNYAESISLLTLAPACVGIFLFLLLMTLFIVLHSLHCCADIRICWTQHKAETIVLYVCVIIPVICMLAMIALAIVGNYWVDKGMTNFLDGMTSFVDDLYSVANQTSSLLAEVGVSITDTVDQVSSLRRTYNQYKGWVYDAELARMIALYCLYGFFASFLIMTLILLTCEINCPTSVIIFWLSMVMIVMVFIILPLSVAGGAVGSDICDLYDQTSQGIVPASLDRLLGNLGANCSTFDDAISSLNQYLNTSIQSACSSYTDFCATGCGGCLGPCGPCNNINDIIAIQNQTLNEIYTCDNSTGGCPSGSCSGTCIGNASCICYTQTLTIRQCATYCRAEPYLNNSRTLISYVDLAIRYNDTITQVDPYLGCGVFQVWSVKTKNPLCVDLLSGVFLTFVAMAAFGLPWIPFMLAVLLLGDRSRSEGKDEDDAIEMLEHRKTKEMKKKEKYDTFRKNETIVWTS